MPLWPFSPSLTNANPSCSLYSTSLHLHHLFAGADISFTQMETTQKDNGQTEPHAGDPLCNGSGWGQPLCPPGRV